VSAAVRIGTQGWSYADWVGTFYPPGSKQQDYLPFYARVFDTVELDTTFYNPPRPSVVRSWARHTPATFRFTAKVPQGVTHGARLARTGEQMAAFLEALGPLGERLGPLLVQMPPDFERDAGTQGVLDRFLDACPEGARIAVEFRHRSWQDPAVWDLLRARRACLVWNDWRDLPLVHEVTADFLYVRWMGRREDVERFDRTQVDREADLASWARAIQGALPGVREVYGTFNNHWAGHSPASANAMKKRLGLDAVEPKTQWPQGELW